MEKSYGKRKEEKNKKNTVEDITIAFAEDNANTAKKANTEKNNYQILVEVESNKVNTNDERTESSQKSSDKTTIKSNKRKGRKFERIE